MRSNDDSIRCRDVALAALTLAALACLLALASCHTYEAVVEAPPDFWLTLEGMVWAVIQDIGDLLSLLL